MYNSFTSKLEDLWFEKTVGDPTSFVDMHCVTKNGLASAHIAVLELYKNIDILQAFKVKI